MTEPLDLKQVAKACEDRPVTILVAGQALHGKFLHVGDWLVAFAWDGNPTWIRLDAIHGIQWTPEPGAGDARCPVPGARRDDG